MKAFPDTTQLAIIWGGTITGFVTKTLPLVQFLSYSVATIVSLLYIYRHFKHNK